MYYAMVNIGEGDEYIAKVKTLDDKQEVEGMEACGWDCVGVFLSRSAAQAAIDKALEPLVWRKG